MKAFFLLKLPWFIIFGNMLFIKINKGSLKQTLKNYPFFLWLLVFGGMMIFLSFQKPGSQGSLPDSQSRYAEKSGTKVRLQESWWKQAAAKMVNEQIKARGVEDKQVLEVMKRVPRHKFVPDKYRSRAYSDRPLPIGEGQTISQPFIVALMTANLELSANDKVLEIGTGSGYQAAILAELAGEVYTMEIVEKLAINARQRLKNMKYANVHVQYGDGYQGWPEEAPFDKIIVTAAPESIPKKLVKQLKNSGKMILPVGENYQLLKVINKTAQGKVEEKTLTGVRFVPMVHPEKE